MTAIEKARVEYLNEKGYNLKRIAEELGLTQRTVGSYVERKNLKKNGYPRPDYDSIRDRYEAGEDRKKLADEIGATLKGLEIWTSRFKWKNPGYKAGPKKKVLTRDEIIKILTLREQGFSYHKIGQQMHKSHVLVAEIIKASL